MSLATNRLTKEWRDIQRVSPASASLHALCQALPYSTPLPPALAARHPREGIMLFPRSASLFSWTALVSGPHDTPFEAARWELAITVPPGYPHAPPAVAFVTPLYHPNVDLRTGEICLDVLKSSWVASWTLEAVCRAVGVLLGSPQADSPLNLEAGTVLRSGDVRGYWAMAKMFAIDYAILLPVPGDGDGDDDDDDGDDDNSGGKKTFKEDDETGADANASKANAGTTVVTPMT